MIKPIGFTEEQAKAIRALERAIKRLGALDIKLIGNSSDLTVVTREAWEKFEDDGYSSPLCQAAINIMPGVYDVNTNGVYEESIGRD